MPEYVVPARWPLVDVLPVTVSGKIDRKALVDAVLGDGTSVAICAGRGVELLRFYVTVADVGRWWRSAGSGLADGLILRPSIRGARRHLDRSGVLERGRRDVPPHQCDTRRLDRRRDHPHEVEA